MRVTHLSCTRVVSDYQFGNYQTTSHAELEPGDDPAVEFAKLRQLASWQRREVRTASESL